MDPSTARVPNPVAFTDGLGERRHTDGPDNEAFEVLTLRKDLTTVPAFEFALRERVSRLAGFRHASYGSVRGVSRLGTDASSLALVSDRVAGDRLSNILAVADRELIPLEIGAGMELIRQLVDAVAVLHETIREVCHGAIALERVVMTPDARLVLVEHVFGASLSSLQYSRDRYWKELRVALPPTAGAPHFDRRADVTQIGAIALALITGRPLADNDYPDRVSEIVSRIGAVSASGGLEPLPPVFRSWLSRALQLDPRQSFGSAVEAREELDRVLAETGYAPSPASLNAFLAQYRALHVVSAPAVAAPIAFPSASPVPATPPSAKRPASSPSVKRPTSPSSANRPSSSPSVSRPASSPRTVIPAPSGTQRVAQISRAVPIVVAPPRRRFVVAAGIFVTIMSMATLTARSYLLPVEGPPAGTGTLVVTTLPVGATVMVDGRQRGKTPLTLPLLPGEHQVEVVGETGRRSLPVFVLAGGHVGHFIEFPDPGPNAVESSDESVPNDAVRVTTEVRLPVEPSVTAEPEIPSATSGVASQTAPEAASSSGWISVAAPADVKLYVNRQLLGSSRTPTIVAAAGRHQVDIVNESLGYKVTRSVTVTPGKVSAVKLDWPKGSLSVNALPWAEVSIDGEKLGETPIGNVSLPIGTHEVVFRHPELGEQRHRVTVKATAPARLSVDLRKK